MRIMRETKRRRGFSFAEVMFAVVVLGVGFIMIAAIFPVAISQSQASVGETYGVTAAVGGVSAMTQLATGTVLNPSVLSPQALGGVRAFGSRSGSNA